jgi:two-component system NtrC family sensor kinase
MQPVASRGPVNKAAPFPVIARQPAEASSLAEASPLDEAAQRERLDLIGRMATSVVHELRNPLASIVATVQSLLAFTAIPSDSWADGSSPSTPTTLPPQVREDLELVVAEARRAGDIVTNLLSFARQTSSDHRPISLSDVVRRTVALCRHHLEMQKVQLVAQYPARSEEVWIRGNTNQLQQVVVNLVDNACDALKAVGQGGVIRVTASRRGQRAALIVEDSGPGIPPAELDKIFQPFHTTKPPGQGTGLGLSICAAIVARHQGTIGVERSSLGGARFVMWFPLCRPQQEQTQQEAGALSPAAGVLGSRPGGATPRRILLVDDEAGIRHSVGRFLRAQGYLVEEAASGEAAVQLLECHSFDAVISDLWMPGLGGEAFFQQVREAHPDLVRRFVFTSGDTLRPETLTFLRGTGCRWLQKPFELSELMTLLEALFESPPPDPLGVAQRGG